MNIIIPGADSSVILPDVFKFVIENITDFIGIYDLDLRPAYINKEGLDLVGIESLAELN